MGPLQFSAFSPCGVDSSQHVAAVTPQTCINLYEKVPSHGSRGRRRAYVAVHASKSLKHSNTSGGPCAGSPESVAAVTSPPEIPCPASAHPHGRRGPGNCERPRPRPPCCPH